MYIVTIKVRVGGETIMKRAEFHKFADVFAYIGNNTSLGSGATIIIKIKENDSPD